MSQRAAAQRSRVPASLRAPIGALVTVVVAGCAGLAKDEQHDWTSAAPVELTETPFFPQERYQCGPAALMTTLTYSGARIELAELTERVFLPGRQGSLQADMVAATRSAGRVPYRLEPSLAGLIAELAAGRPVVVLQNLGVSWFPRWHYAVVIGIEPDSDRVLLRSGTDPRRVTDIGTFMRTWNRSGHWAIVTLRPGELPARADRLRYFEALAAMEQTGHFAAARDGWTAALQRWPADPVALFGLANSEFALDRFAAAESAYRQLLAIDPQALMARNNLAYALAAQGRTREAMGEIKAALEQAGGDAALRSELEDSLADIGRDLNSR